MKTSLNSEIMLYSVKTKLVKLLHKKGYTFIQHKDIHQRLVNEFIKLWPYNDGIMEMSNKYKEITTKNKK